MNLSKFNRAVPWVILAMCAAWLVSSLRPAPEGQYRTRAFGQLPVLLNGRVQPLDSVARNSLLVIRNKQTVLLEKMKSMPAIDWLMEVLMKPELANTRKIFRIDHPELLDLLKLSHDDKFFAFDQLKTSIQALQQQTERISKIDEKLHTPFEKQVMKLANAFWLYDRLKNSLKPEDMTDFAVQLDQYQQSIGPGMVAVQAREAGKSFDQAALDKMIAFLGPFEAMSRVAYPLLAPPLNPSKSRDEWENIGFSLMNSVRSGQIHPAVRSYAAMCAAFRQDKPGDFNRAVAEYRLWLQEHNFTPELRKGQWEFLFNHFEPFYKSMVLYVGAFLLACFFWVYWSEPLRRSAFYILVLALGVHTVGLITRMFLEGRPPVTNLYSSAVFIGWGAVVLGLILERFYRDGIGIVTASALGFITQLIAHHLALISPTGDTMEMLRAVLDTNFWLATHVVTITIGYSATFMAGFLAIIFILRGFFTRTLSEASADGLNRMVYGIICFATLFSFVGTVLGGIWADQSWGRFWGWDPKENGALLIVLWNAAILHARWGGLIEKRGLMNMAIFGNIVTSFSWFGVNMLGIGLHSYGFMDQAFKWLVAFIASQLGLIWIGCYPLARWKSFQSPPGGTPPNGTPPQPPASIQEKPAAQTSISSNP